MVDTNSSLDQFVQDSVYLQQRLAIVSRATDLPASAGFDLARSNLSDSQLESTATMFGAPDQPGWGLGSVLDHLLSTDPKSVGVGDLKALQTNLQNGGYLAPDYQPTGVWDPTSSSAFARSERDAREQAEAGGTGISTTAMGAVRFIGGVMPATVFQRVVGAAEGIVKETPDVASRLGAAGGAAAGAAIGGSLGLAFGGIGAVPGALVGAGIGAVAGFAADLLNIGGDDSNQDEKGASGLSAVLDPFLPNEYFDYRTGGARAFWNDLGWVTTVASIPQSAALVTSGIGAAAGMAGVARAGGTLATDAAAAGVDATAAAADVAAMSEVTGAAGSAGDVLSQGVGAASHFDPAAISGMAPKPLIPAAATVEPGAEQAMMGRLASWMSPTPGAESAEAGWFTRLITDGPMRGPVKGILPQGVKRFAGGAMTGAGVDWIGSELTGHESSLKEQGIAALIGGIGASFLPGLLGNSFIMDTAAAQKVASTFEATGGLRGLPKTVPAAKALSGVYTGFSTFGMASYYLGGIGSGDRTTPLEAAIADAPKLPEWTNLGILLLSPERFFPMGIGDVAKQLSAPVESSLDMVAVGNVVAQRDGVSFSKGVKTALAEMGPTEADRWKWMAKQKFDYGVQSMAVKRVSELGISPGDSNFFSTLRRSEAAIRREALDTAVGRDVPPEHWMQEIHADWQKTKSLDALMPKYGVEDVERVKALKTAPPEKVPPVAGPIEIGDTVTLPDGKVGRVQGISTGSEGSSTAKIKIEGKRNYEYKSLDDLTKPGSEKVEAEALSVDPFAPVPESHIGNPLFVSQETKFVATGERTQFNAEAERMRKRLLDKGGFTYDPQSGRFIEVGPRRYIGVGPRPGDRYVVSMTHGKSTIDAKILQDPGKFADYLWRETNRNYPLLQQRGGHLGGELVDGRLRIEPVDLVVGEERALRTAGLRGTGGATRLGDLETIQPPPEFSHTSVIGEIMSYSSPSRNDVTKGPWSFEAFLAKQIHRGDGNLGGLGDYGEADKYTQEIQRMIVEQALPLDVVGGTAAPANWEVQLLKEEQAQLQRDLKKYQGKSSGLSGLAPTELVQLRQKAFVTETRIHEITDELKIASKTKKRDLSQIRIVPQRIDTPTKDQLLGYVEQYDELAKSVQTALIGRNQAEVERTSHELGSWLGDRIREGVLNDALASKARRGDPSMAIKSHLRRAAVGSAREVKLPENMAAKLESMGYRAVQAGEETVRNSNIDWVWEPQVIGDFVQRHPFWAALGNGSKWQSDYSILKLRRAYTQNELDDVVARSDIPMTGKDLNRRLNGALAEKQAGRSPQNEAVLQRLGAHDATMADTAEKIKALPHAGRITLDNGQKITFPNDLRDLTPDDVARALDDVVGIGDRAKVAQEVFSAIHRGAAFGGEWNPIKHPIQTAHDLGHAMRIEGLPGFSDMVRTWHTEQPTYLRDTRNLMGWGVKYEAPAEVASAPGRSAVVNVFHDVAAKSAGSSEQVGRATMVLDAMAQGAVESGAYKSLEEFYSSIDAAAAEKFVADSGDAGWLYATQSFMDQFPEVFPEIAVRDIRGASPHRTPTAEDIASWASKGEESEAMWYERASERLAYHLGNAWTTLSGGEVTVTINKAATHEKAGWPGLGSGVEFVGRKGNKVTFRVPERKNVSLYELVTNYIGPTSTQTPPFVNYRNAMDGLTAHLTGDWEKASARVAELGVDDALKQAMGEQIRQMQTMSKGFTVDLWPDALKEGRWKTYNYTLNHQLEPTAEISHDMFGWTGDIHFYQHLGYRSQLSMADDADKVMIGAINEEMQKAYLKAGLKYPHQVQAAMWEETRSWLVEKEALARSLADDVEKTDASRATELRSLAGEFRKMHQSFKGGHYTDFEGSSAGAARLKAVSGAFEARKALEGDAWGQIQFQRINSRVVGAQQMGPDGQVLMRFFSGADTGTLVHEQAHALRRLLPEDQLEVLGKALKIDWAHATSQDEERFVEVFNHYLTTRSAEPAFLSPMKALSKSLGETWGRYRGFANDKGLVDPNIVGVLDKWFGEYLPQVAKGKPMKSGASRVLMGAALGAGAGYMEGHDMDTALKGAVAGAAVTGGLRYMAARSYGYLPEAIAELNMALRFSFSPMFDARRFVKQNVISGLRGDPMFMQSEKAIGAREWKSLYGTGTVRGSDAWNEAIQFFDEVHGGRFGRLADDMDRTFANQGILGYSPIKRQVATAYWLKQRGKSAEEIQHELQNIFSYGGGRTPIERSINFIFFPFSFEKKLATTTANYFISAPIRNLVLQEGMNRYYEANYDDKVKEFLEKHAPILKWAGRFNALSHGLSAGEFAFAGLNEYKTNSAKMSFILTQALAPGAINSNLADTMATGTDMMVNAFTPIVVSNEAIGRYGQRNLADLVAGYVPMIRDLNGFWDKASDQMTAIKSPTHEGKYSQYQGYNDGMRAERRRLDRVGNAFGLAGYEGLLRSETFGPMYEQQYLAVQQELATKYPDGFSMAQQHTDFGGIEEQALYELANQDERTAAQDEILKLKQMEATSKSSFESINYTSSQSLPMISQTLRAEAIKHMTEPGFVALWDKFFAYTYGPIERIAA